VVLTHSQQETSWKFRYFRISNFVAAIDHNKSYAAFVCKSSLANPKGQLDNNYWPKGPVKDGK